MARSRCLAAAASLLACAQYVAHGYLADVPPRGMNTWDSYFVWATEADALANAHIMSTSLLAAGYDTLVIDEAWFRPFNNTSNGGGIGDPYNVAMDGFGRYFPSPDKFTNGSFAHLCAALNASGLKCGAHVITGIPMLAYERNTPIEGSCAWTARDIADTSVVLGGNQPGNYGLNVSHPGTYPFIYSQMATLANAGVAFIKLDFMCCGNETTQLVTLYRTALNASSAVTGVPVVLSVNGLGTSPEQIAYWRSIGVNMERIADDMWDEWAMVLTHIPRMAATGPFGGPGNWPDADMLPIGFVGGRANVSTTYTYPCTDVEYGCGDPAFAQPYPQCCPRASRFTFNETRSVMSLWQMARSPMFMGGDLTQTDPSVIALLANTEVAAVSTDVVTGSNYQVYADNFTLVWTSTPAPTGNARYLMIMNLNDTAADITVDLDSLFATPVVYPGLADSAYAPTSVVVVSRTGLRSTSAYTYSVRDLWAHADVGNVGSNFTTPAVPAHAAYVFSVVQLS